MGAAGFWDDQERAAQVTAEHARATRKLGVFRELESDVEDLEPLAELAEEDPEMATELEEQLASVQERLDALEEERLFSGRYDSGDALVTVNAGAGGTDAQDWAEMVLRMEMRWAEKRGFGVELLEASPGRRPGSSRPPSASGARTPTACTARRRASTGWCACRRSTRPTAARRASPGVEVSPVVEETADVQIDDDDLQIDTYRASGAGGQHVNKTDSAVRITHKPTGIVVQCQNERSQSSNKAEAMAMLRSKLAELEERKRREEIAARAGRGPGRQLRLADPLLRPAPLHDGQGPPHGLRDGRRQPRPRRRPRRLRARLPPGGREMSPPDEPRNPREPDEPRDVLPEPPPPHPRAADRAVPGRDRLLRVPRLGALPRARPQGRTGRRSRDCARRSASARWRSTSARTSRASTSAPARPPTSAPRSWPPPPTALGRRGF